MNEIMIVHAGTEEYNRLVAITMDAQSWIDGSIPSHIAVRPYRCYPDGSGESMGILVDGYHDGRTASRLVTREEWDPTGVDRLGRATGCMCWLRPTDEAVQAAISAVMADLS